MFKVKGMTQDSGEDGEEVSVVPPVPLELKRAISGGHLPLTVTALMWVMLLPLVSFQGKRRWQRQVWEGGEFIL